MRKYIPFASLMVACAAFTSCTDQYTICNQAKISNLNSSFRTISNNTDVSFTPAALTMRDITSGNLLFDQRAGISSVSSNLSLSTDSTSFSLQVAPAMPTDTFTVYYSKSRQFLSLECGEIDVFTINRISNTTHKIDSIKLVDAAVNNNYLPNLRIYF
ncbi:MAG: hypothetical protein EOO03_00280 [Chitinophagaceae bacterium]|nr:MAG: hypothetical protein EOO03_00280 [Chitinophagaceae bacterium]